MILTLPYWNDLGIKVLTLFFIIKYADLNSKAFLFLHQLPEALFSSQVDFIWHAHTERSDRIVVSLRLPDARLPRHRQTIQP